MPIEFIEGWDGTDNGHANHESARSQQEVERIISEISQLELDQDDSSGRLGMALQMGEDFAGNVEVTKGIHDRTRQGGSLAHITVRLSGVTYHIHLKQINDRQEDDGSTTFVWQARAITAER